MNKNYNKVSFNLQQEANAKLCEMLDKGCYLNKTELLNAAILMLYDNIGTAECMLTNVSYESFAKDENEYQEFPDNYHWALLAHLINPYVYPAPNMY